MRRRRKGLSLGTVLALFLCLLAVGGFLWFVRTIGHDSPAAAMRLDELAEVVGEVLLAPRSGSTAVPTAAPTPLNQTVSPATRTPAPQPVSLTMTLAGTLRLDSDILASQSYQEGGAEVLGPLHSLLHSDLSVVALAQGIEAQPARNDSAFPPEALELLRDAGVDAALHAPGTPQAGPVLQGAGLRPLGTAEDGLSAFRINGLNIAWLHTADAGLAAPQASTQPLEQRIAELKAVYDVLILSMHWPTPKGHAPSAHQVTVAHRLAQAGADLILGFGGEQVQQIEVYQLPTQGGQQRDVLIAYSMGTLLSEHRTRQELQAGMLLHLRASVWPGGQGLLLDRIGYSPTHVRRWTDKGGTRFAVLPAAEAPPEGMSGAQREAMARSLRLIVTALHGSPAQLQR